MSLEAEQLYYEDIQLGAEVPRLMRSINLVQMVMYQAATWDFFLGHYDVEFCRERGFRQPFVDGQMFGSLLAQLLTNWVGPRGAVKRLSFRNAGLVYAGETVTCGGSVVRKYQDGEENVVELELWCHKQDGAKAAWPASATVALPSKQGAKL